MSRAYCAHAVRAKEVYISYCIYCITVFPFFFILKNKEKIIKKKRKKKKERRKESKAKKPPNALFEASKRTV